MKVAFIGGGNMAHAIIGGLLSKAAAQAGDIVVVEPDAAARDRLRIEHRVRSIEAPGPELATTEVVIFAVKPQNMHEAAARVAAVAGDALFITIAAGIRIGDLSRWLGGRSRIVRAMPNTPALVHAGITGLHASPAVGAADRARAETLLASVGATVWFDDEGDLDAVTAVSGSGPAYVFYAIEALEEAARGLGLSPQAARALALGTFSGATKLAHRARRGAGGACARRSPRRAAPPRRALKVLEAARRQATIRRRP